MGVVSLIECLDYKASKMGFNVYVFIKTVRRDGKTYRYLVIEEYDPETKRKRVLLHLSLRKILERFKDEKDSPWCGGWDLNPRRPTPSGPKPDPSKPGSNAGDTQGNYQPDGFLKQRLGISLSQKLESEFLAWCIRKASREICQQYLKKIHEIDVGGRQIEDTRWHITAYKRFTKFLCEKGNNKACEDFKRVKSRRSNPDLYIPSDGEIRNALNSPLGDFYLALLESGLRAVEVARVLSESSKLRWVEIGGFARVELNWRRGAKRAYWGYFLERKPEESIDLDELQEKRQALGLVGFKYIRKYVATRLVELGCNELSIDFIQGRVPQSILGKHYARLIIAADNCYRKYASWLREWLGLGGG